MVAFVGDGARSIVADPVPALLENALAHPGRFDKNVTLFYFSNGTFSGIRTYRERLASRWGGRQMRTFDLLPPEGEHNFGPLTLVRRTLVELRPRLPPRGAPRQAPSQRLHGAARPQRRRRRVHPRQHRLAARTSGSDLEAPMDKVHEGLSALYHYLATADEALPRAVRRVKRAAPGFSLPVPRAVARPALWGYLAAREAWELGMRVLVCPAPPPGVLQAVRAGPAHRRRFVHLVQGQGDIILGDDVWLDGKCDHHLRRQLQRASDAGDRRRHRHRPRYGLHHRQAHHHREELQHLRRTRDFRLQRPPHRPDRPEEPRGRRRWTRFAR